MRLVPGFHDAELTALEWREGQVICRFAGELSHLLVKGEGLIVWSAGECLPVIVHSIASVSPEEAQIDEDKRQRLRRAMDETKREWCLLILTSVGDEVAILGSGELETEPDLREF